MRVLVTGASGFVGGAVVRRLQLDGAFEARAAARRRVSGDASECIVGDLGAQTDWTDALRGCDAVVHAAARVHQLRDRSADPLTDYRAANVDGTMRLARQAVDAGVRRFIFLSSVKVHGESSAADHLIREDDARAPVDPYGVSKAEAEDALTLLASEYGLEVVVLRPALVYGPGVKANFRAMMRWVNSGVPLPLGALHNRRSFLALDNLVDVVVRCLDHPAAANQAFLLSDGNDLSTNQLLQRTAMALGRPSRLFSVSPNLLRFAGTLTGRSESVRRLSESLRVDSGKVRRLLAWTPPVSVDEALAVTARYYLAHLE